MNLEQQIDAYFQALNSRDAGQVAKLFAPEGTYEDPVTRIPVHPYDLGTVMESIAAVFPDFQFETTAKTVTDKRGVAEWVQFCSAGSPGSP